MDKKFAEVDNFFISKLVSNDKVLDKILENNSNKGLPAHDVSASQGQFLYLMSKMNKTKRILEIGTLGGYSTYWFAKSLPEDGHILSLEYNQLNAEVAAENLELAGVTEKTEIRVGLAADTLADLIEENVDSFDLIFIDADKENNSVYLKLALKLSHSGTVIIGDNIVRDGEIINEESTDTSVKGSQSFIDDLSRLENITSTAIETIGVKGYDGFTISLVN